jgi:tRNA dimethylallyltransferase
VTFSPSLPIIILVGPTSVGKTDLAIPLAQELHTEIISADSRQIYRYLDIGTGKPSPQQLASVPHHLISIVAPDEYFSVADYLQKALDLIADFGQLSKIPLVVGGTGLYIKALTRGLFKGPGPNIQIRQHLKQKVREKGLSHLYLELQEIDPQAAQKIHPHDEQRIIRALEVYYQAGIPISILQRNKTSSPLPSPILILGLKREMNDLYQKIEARIDRMFQEGLVEEVENLLAQNYSEDLNALNAIGYRDVIAYLRGKQTLETTKYLFKRDTRRLAKRQMTWFRKEEQVRWYDLTGSNMKDMKYKEVLAKIKSDIYQWLDQLAIHPPPTTISS